MYAMIELGRFGRPCDLPSQFVFTRSARWELIDSSLSLDLNCRRGRRAAAEVIRDGEALDQRFAPMDYRSNADSKAVASAGEAVLDENECLPPVFPRAELTGGIMERRNFLRAPRLNSRKLGLRPPTSSDRLWRCRGLSKYVDAIGKEARGSKSLDIAALVPKQKTLQGPPGRVSEAGTHLLVRSG